MGPAAQYGLFLADDDPKRGVWLDSGRTLEHYLLRENVSKLALKITSKFALNNKQSCNCVSSYLALLWRLRNGRWNEALTGHSLSSESLIYLAFSISTDYPPTSFLNDVVNAM